MKVGDYVRTKYVGGSIEKILEIIPKEETPDLMSRYTTDISKIYGLRINEDEIIKSSPNIIDLIEVGDYVNGIQITSIENDNKGKYVFGYGADGMEGEMWFYNDNIKSIVTHEQFSQMEYKIGE